MEKLKHFLWFQFPAMVWATAIFIQSSMSSIVTPDLGIDFEDKISHAVVYAILGTFLRRALVFQKNQFFRRHAGWLTFVIGTVYAISDEIHQSFVPGRFSDVDDAIADIIGIILVIFIYFSGKQIKQWKNRKSVIRINHSVL